MQISCRLLLATILTFTATFAAQQSAPAAQIEAPPLQGGPAVPPPPTGAVRISGGVMAGQCIKRVRPEYPSDVVIQGTVVLRAIIGTDGRVQQLSAISGPPMLQNSAVDAVRQWEYKPYLLNGEPVKVETTITVNFRR